MFSQVLKTSKDGDAPTSLPQGCSMLPVKDLYLLLLPSASAKNNLAPSSIISICPSKSCRLLLGPILACSSLNQTSSRAFPQQLEWGAAKTSAGSQMSAVTLFPRGDVFSLQRVPMTSSSKEHNTGLHRLCLPPPCPQGTQTLFTPPDVSNTKVVFPQFASIDSFGLFFFNVSQMTVMQMGSGPHSWPQRASRASPVCPYEMSEHLQAALSLLPNRCPC